MEDQTDCGHSSGDVGIHFIAAVKTIRRRFQLRLRGVCHESQGVYERVVQALEAFASFGPNAFGFIAVTLLCVAVTPARAASSGIAAISLGDKTTTLGFQGVVGHDQVVVLTANGQAGSFSYALPLHPAWITIDANTGYLTENVPKTAAAIRDWSFTVQVTNTQNHASSAFKTSLYVMQTEVVASKVVGPGGGQLNDPFESVVLTVPAGVVTQSTKFSILRGTEADGQYAYTVTPNIQSSTPPQLYLPDPYLRQTELQQLTAQHKNPYAKPPSPRDRDGSGGWLQWASWPAQFLFIDETPNSLARFNRLANDLRNSVPSLAGLYSSNQSAASELWTPCGTEDQFSQGTTTCAGKDPVLFIGGYTLFGNLSGGSDEWAKFPEELCNPNFPCTPTESTNRLAVFEFTWRTNARFQDAADDLANAISLIHLYTGRPVHIVAHSFGGLLARAYLQGFAVKTVKEGGGSRAYAGDVASLNTLGTPHSGIYSGDTEAFGMWFPNGQDSPLGIMNACEQLSCIDAGIPASEAYTYFGPLGPVDLSGYFGESAGPGVLVEFLASGLKGGQRLPVPTQALMGLTNNGTVFNEGDVLISYGGQRLHPELSCSEPNGPCGFYPINESLLTGYGNGVDVVEHMLGFPSEPKPLDPVPTGSSLGYRHVINLKLFGLTIPVQLPGSFGETGVGFNGANNCGDADAHPACQAVLDWIEAHPATPSQEKQISFNIKVLDASSGAPIAGATVNMGALPLANGAQHTDANGLATLTTVFYANTPYAAYAFADGYQSESVVGYTTLSKPPNGAANFTPIQLQSLSLSPATGSLGGTVTNAATGAPLAGVPYQLLKADSLFPVTSGTTASNGKYRINQLIQGAYLLQLHQLGFRDGSFTFFVAPAQVSNGNAALQRSTVVTEQVLYSFGASAIDGQSPNSPLIQSSNGNFYGTTIGGGAGLCTYYVYGGCGTFFEISLSGKEVAIYSFTGGTDGLEPSGSLVEDNTGNFFGTTTFGGAGPNCPSDESYPGCGTIFKVAPTGTESMLYTFDNSTNEVNPGALIQGRDGSFYGTVLGASGGEIFKVTTAGVKSVMYAFTGGADGGAPTSLIQGNDGNFYGTTERGGAANFGTVFMLTAAGVETVLYSFTHAADGDSPGSLIQGRDGNFYGVARSPSAFYYGGTVFKVIPTGVFTVLYTFTGGSDGGYPTDLIQGSDGNFYGTTTSGGIANCVLGDPEGCGVVFRVTPAGAESVIYSFAGMPDGQWPQGLVQGRDGNFYGSTYWGGKYNRGALFELTFGN